MLHSDDAPGTLDVDPAASGTEVLAPPGGALDPNATPTEPFLSTTSHDGLPLNYKDKAAAEKGMREQRAAITKAQQRTADLEKELAQRKTLEAIEASVTQQNSPKPESFDARIEKLWDKFEAAGLTREQFDLQADLLYEQHSEQEKAVEAKLQALDDRYTADMAAMRSQVQGHDPAYLLHRERVEELMERGVPREVALNLAQDTKLFPPTVEETRAMPLGADTTSRVAGATPARLPISEAEFAAWEALDREKISKEDRAMLQKMRAANQAEGWGNERPITS